jgi:hypothetical protein
MDKDRDSSERVHRSIECATCAGICRQIGLNERRPDFGGDVAAALGVDVDDGELCAFSTKRTRDSASDSGRDARDECALFREQRAQMPRSRMLRTGWIGSIGSIAPNGSSGVPRPCRAARARR